MVALLIAATSVVHAWIPGESRAQRGAAFIARLPLASGPVMLIVVGFVLRSPAAVWKGQDTGLKDKPLQLAGEMLRGYLSVPMFRCQEWQNIGRR